MSSAQTPRVTVVMAVYHPDMARLAKQIQTIRSQSNVELNLRLFADGPMPQLDQIAELVRDFDDVRLENLPNNCGPAETFLTGIERSIESDPRAEFIAFADQDDLWFENKLARGISALVKAGAAAVHTDGRLVDGAGVEIAASMFAYENRDRSPSLQRLFFRNNATGMTMVLTRALALRLIELRDQRPQVWLHDHFAAFLAMASDGLIFEHEPTVDYAQHGGNVVGVKPTRPGVGASGNFMKAGSRTDLALQQGLRLVETLLQADGLTSQSRAELVELDALLKGRGIADLLSSAGSLLALTRNVRPLLARLAWCKLTRHRW